MKLSILGHARISNVKCNFYCKHSNFLLFFFIPLHNSLLQLGTMISTEPTVLEACGGLIPDPRDLRNLLLHQQAKGLLGVKGRSVTN